MKTHKISRNYFNLLKDIKTHILEGQCTVLRAVNKELIALYWDIGEMIVNRQLIVEVITIEHRQQAYR